MRRATSKLLSAFRTSPTRLVLKKAIAPFTSSTLLTKGLKPLTRANVASFSKETPVAPIVTLTLKRFFASGSYPSHNVLDMPALSPTMKTGNLVSWNVKEGDQISQGSALAEVETDKATVTFESQEEGYVAKILLPAGSSDVEVGTPVIVIVDNKKDVAAFKDFSAKSKDAKAPEPAKKEAQPEKAEKPAKAEKAEKAEKAPEPAKKESKQAQAAPAQSSASGSRVVASPLAKSLAKDRGVDLSQLAGTGPNNRILAADVKEFKPRAAAAAAAPSTSTSAYEDLNITTMRKVIAERLSYSKQNIPHYYLTMEIDVGAMLALRTTLNDTATKGEYKLSVNDFLVKASAIALRKVPQCNSSWADTVIRRFNTVDINVAVSADDGLYTPLVSNADLRGLVSISETVKNLADKARQKKISPEELAPGTFTISNLGMFGISHFSAVINPPQACILAVGGTSQKVVPNPAAKPGEDKYKVISVMSVTLSCDHRVVDGAVGAKWLQIFKDLIENPTKMLL